MEKNHLITYQTRKQHIFLLSLRVLLLCRLPLPPLLLSCSLLPLLLFLIRICFLSFL